VLRGEVLGAADVAVPLAVCAAVAMVAMGFLVREVRRAAVR
jgi:hypothetical protein